MTAVRTPLILAAMLATAACGGASPAARSDVPATLGSPSIDGGDAVASLGSFEIQERPFSFASRGAELSGALLLPVGAERPSVAVLVHDFGPMGRDGLVRESFGLRLPVEVPVYRGIAEHLASQGVAVLLYDKRTCTEGTEPWCSYPREYVEAQRDELGDALVADVKAAVEALAGDAALGDSVTLIGHGQGAEVALAAAAGLDAVHRVALLTPSPEPVDAVVIDQAERSVQLLEKRIAEVGDTPEADLLKKNLEAATAQAERVKSGFAALRANQQTEELLGLTPQGWRSLFAVHEAFLAGLSGWQGELIVVAGDADLVYAADAGERLEALVRQRGDDSFVLLPDLTHLLVDVGAKSDSSRVSPRVLGALIELLKR